MISFHGRKNNISDHGWTSKLRLQDSMTL